VEGKTVLVVEREGCNRRRGSSSKHPSQTLLKKEQHTKVKLEPASRNHPFNSSVDLSRLLTSTNLLADTRIVLAASLSTLRVQQIPPPSTFNFLRPTRYTRLRSDLQHLSGGWENYGGCGRALEDEESRPVRFPLVPASKSLISRPEKPFFASTAPFRPPSTTETTFKNALYLTIPLSTVCSRDPNLSSSCFPSVVLPFPISSVSSSFHAHLFLLGILEATSTGHMRASTSSSATEGFIAPFFLPPSLPSFPPSPLS
jgi:hypothetical protein